MRVKTLEDALGRGDRRRRLRNVRIECLLHRETLRRIDAMYDLIQGLDRFGNGRGIVAGGLEPLVVLLGQELERVAALELNQRLRVLVPPRIELTVAIVLL